MGAEEPRAPERGPLAWFAKNSVAANILMLVFLVGGALNLRSIKQEVFPDAGLDKILINVPYPGASPEEVEQGVVLAVEEAVRGLEGVKEVQATALEGFGVVVVDLLRGTDPDPKLSEVKAAVDRIVSFPEDAERPSVFLAGRKMEVLSLVIYGDVPESTLRHLADRTREELLRDRRITEVEVAGVRPLEVSIEVPQRILRRHRLTLEQIAHLVRQGSVEIPGGALKTPGGEVLLRMDERRDRGHEYEGIVVLTHPDGTEVTLGDLAEVRDGFAESDVQAFYNGKPAVMVQVFRTGDQTPIDVSRAVREYTQENAGRLPPGVEFATWFDTSEMFRDRVELLVKNAFIGLALVLVVLGFFLEVRLAFWVVLAIPVCFIGSLLLLPLTDISINMMSLFAFIIVLGMVVDDAIIVGDAIFRQRQAGKGRYEAAIAGVREVAAPVTFAVVTTIFAFLPMLFVPGPMGNFARAIPITVIIVFLISLFESLFILPAHLAHSKRSEQGLLAFVDRQQARFSRLLERFIAGGYVPFLRLALRHRYTTLAAAFAAFVVTVGLLAGGRMEQTFMPQIDGEIVVAKAKLPYGTAVERTRVLHDTMLATANELLEEVGGARVSRGVLSQVGGPGIGGFNPTDLGIDGGGGHLTDVAIYLVSANERPVGAKEFADRWRARLKDSAPGLEKLSFDFFTGVIPGSPVHVELSHPDSEILRVAARRLADRLEEFEGSYDIEDGYELGKPQLGFRIRPAARSLGVTSMDLARQLRAAFFGAEAARQQRGRDEVRTYVRLPRRERESEYFVEELVIRTPGGGEMPLSQAASVERGRAPTEIKRIDGRRAVAVTAEVDRAVGNAPRIIHGLEAVVLPELMAEFPGLSYAIGGEERERKEVMASLKTGWMLALIAMFALLAVAFRSYLQPAIVLLAVPFGFVGALWGNYLLGFDFNMMSIMGVVALSGIVVNNSLLLVVTINRHRAEGMSLVESVVAGGARRFRPIVLTSLTTFFGLMPMILETSIQALFLVPMAVSLGFGVIFSAFVTLLLVPAVYLILEDLARGARRLRGQAPASNLP